MDNFQVLLINIFIVALWCIIIPCLSAFIYLFFSRSNQGKSIGATPILLVISIILLFFTGYTTLKAQDINPLCNGAGVPDQQICAGRGLVSNSEAIIITRNKTALDLTRTIGIPIVISLALGAASLSVRYWIRAEKVTQ